MKRLVLLTLMACATAWADNPKDLTVESPVDGSRFTLSEHRGQVVALHFLLKTECPYCLRQTHDFARLGEKVPGVIHVFLKPDEGDEIKAWTSRIDRESLKKLPVIYRDPDAKLAKEFGIPDGYRFHGQNVHYPAIVVLDGSGRELFRHVGKSNTDRMTPTEFTARLKAAQDAPKLK